MSKKIKKEFNENIVLKKEEIICIDKELNFYIYFHDGKIYSIPNQLGTNLSYKYPSKQIRSLLNYNIKQFKNKIFECKVETNSGTQKVSCLTFDIIIKLCKLSKVDKKISSKLQASLFLFNRKNKIEINNCATLEEKEKIKIIKEKQKKLQNEVGEARDVVNESYLLFNKSKNEFYENKKYELLRIVKNDVTYFKYLKSLNKFHTEYEKPENKKYIIDMNIKFKQRRLDNAK
jgi:hypothetical protein